MSTEIGESHSMKSFQLNQTEFSSTLFNLIFKRQITTAGALKYL